MATKMSKHTIRRLTIISISKEEKKYWALSFVGWVTTIRIRICFLLRTKFTVVPTLWCPWWWSQLRIWFNLKVNIEAFLCNSFVAIQPGTYVRGVPRR
jgi:hypothetical protein